MSRDTLVLLCPTVRHQDRFGPERDGESLVSACGFEQPDMTAVARRQTMNRCEGVRIAADMFNSFGVEDHRAVS